MTFSEMLPFLIEERQFDQLLKTLRDKEARLNFTYEDR